MELFLLALCWLLLALGFLGCFINKVPGPLAVAIATFIGIVGLNLPIGWGVFTLITILAVGSMFLTKILVELVKTKMHEYSKRGSWGTTIGSLLGLLILMGVGPEEVGTTVIMFIFSFILLPFVFAFLLEMTNKKGNDYTIQASIAATCGYLSDTFLKLIVFALAIYSMIA